MRIRDFIEHLSQYVQDIELVINVDDNFVTPSVNREIVYFKHDVSGISFNDNAIVLSAK